LTLFSLGKPRTGFVRKKKANCHVRIFESQFALLFALSTLRLDWSYEMTATRVLRSRNVFITGAVTSIPLMHAATPQKSGTAARPTSRKNLSLSNELRFNLSTNLPTAESVRIKCLAQGQKESNALLVITLDATAIIKGARTDVMLAPQKY
jgi:hypothetical protein